MGDFYDNLKAYKDARRLNNKELGRLIEMEGEAFRMAVVRKSLTKLQMNVFENLFDETNTEKPPKENPGDLTDDKVVDYVIEHADRLRVENSKFNMFCELIEVKAERNLIKELRRKNQ